MNKLFGLDTPFANFMTTLANIIWTGMLWLVCSLPLFTIGASSAAAYRVTVQVVRGKKSYVTREFFSAFKENFKITLPMQMLALVLFTWLMFDCIYLFGYGTDFSYTLSLILYVFLFVLFAVLFYLYPCVQKFDESRLELFKLAFYMTFRYIFTTLGLLLLFVAALLAVYLMPWSILVVPGVWWYLQSFLIERIIRKFLKNPNEDENDTEEEDSEEDFDEDEEFEEESNFKRKRNLNRWEEEQEENFPEEEDLEEETNSEEDSDENKVAKKGKSLRDSAMLVDRLNRKEEDDFKDKVIPK